MSFSRAGARTRKATISRMPQARVSRMRNALAIGLSGLGDVGGRSSALPVESNQRDRQRVASLNSYAFGDDGRQRQNCSRTGNIVVAGSDELTDWAVTVAERRFSLCRGFRVSKPKERLLLGVNPDVEVRGCQLRLRQKCEQQAENEKPPRVKPRRPHPDLCRKAFHCITFPLCPSFDASHRDSAKAM